MMLGADRKERHGGSPASTGSAGTTVKVKPFSVIGADDRFRVTPTTGYPARATVLIMRNGVQHCTGWMISKDTLLTAGQCLHTGGTDGTWYPGLTFTPGSDGGNAPYGTCTSRASYAFNGWLNSRDSNDDGGIVKLNCTVGNTVGWYGMWWQSASLNGQSTVVIGYPFNKGLTQWASGGSILASETEKIYYQNDTTAGQVGSPVYWVRVDTAPFCTGVCAMGIHTDGLTGTGNGASNNSGMRFTETKFNSIMALVNTP
jgi:glutamyl endopeptidase